MQFGQRCRERRQVDLQREQLQPHYCNRSRAECHRTRPRRLDMKIATQGVAPLAVTLDVRIAYVCTRHRCWRELMCKAAEKRCRLTRWQFSSAKSWIWQQQVKKVGTVQSHVNGDVVGYSDVNGETQAMVCSARDKTKYLVPERGRPTIGHFYKKYSKRFLTSPAGCRAI
jgi:hypothetical protein